MTKRVRGAFSVAATGIGLLCAACTPRAPQLIEHPALSLVSPPEYWDLGEPVWSPDGSQLALSGGEQGGGGVPRGKIYVLDVASGDLRLIEEPDHGYRCAMAWSPDGSEIAFAASFDVEGIWVTSADGSGEPRFLTNGIAAAWSPDGKEMAVIDLVRQEGTALWTWSIRILNLSTGDERVVFSVRDEAADSAGLSWAPDGRRLAFAFGAGELDKVPETDIYTVDSTTGNVARLTHGGFNRTPTWSPDGSLIAYVGASSVFDGHLRIMRSDGLCSVQPLTFDADVVAPDWSPDGTRIALEFFGYTGIYVLDVPAVLGEDFLTVGPECP